MKVKKVPGLFFAGQILTELQVMKKAAGQGLVAGNQRSFDTFRQSAFTLSLTESYIGIMIDDLISLGVDVPYRMFTTRPNIDCHCVMDNTFLRLTDRAYALGLVDEQMLCGFVRKEILYMQLWNLLKLIKRKSRNA
jgi:tRNA uridine 5-carboxymethylaminomethyl modification enzyme